MTMQNVNENCYWIRNEIVSAKGFLALGQLDKALECLDRADDMALKTIKGAIDASKSTL